MVTKLDGTVPTPAAISKAASEFGTEKKKRGRKLGQNKTSKAEDRAIMKTFHKLRPPGQGVLWSPGLLPSGHKALQSRQYLSGHSLCNPFPVGALGSWPAVLACLSFACWSCCATEQDSRFLSELELSVHLAPT